MNSEIKNAIILKGKTYKVVRTLSVAGLGPDPCALCDRTIYKICWKHNMQPCDMFSTDRYLAHFKKVDK